ncbi:nectin-1 isoform X3 [Amia ocellicauda]|uniref:nectin-1 isoform X3 n=1 Tax=Amia ocellicauda TaxID=2972642 RepID=UPI003463ACD3
MYTDWLLHWCNDSKDISRKITWNIFNLAFCSFLLFLPHQISGISVLNGGVTATVGEDTSLTCRLVDTEESISQISWQRKIGLSSEPENFLTFDPDTGPNAVGDFGKRVEFIGNVMRLDGSISIPNPLLSDEGTYICIFTVFPSGPYKHNIRLTVNDPPQLVNITNVENSPLGTIFICETEANPPPTDYHWHRINQTFPSSKIRVDGSRLELLEQSPDVNGMYVCEASTKFGKAFGSIYIHIGGGLFLLTTEVRQIIVGKVVEYHFQPLHPLEIHRKVRKMKWGVHKVQAKCRKSRKGPLDKITAAGLYFTVCCSLHMPYQHCKYCTGVMLLTSLGE